MDAKYVMAALAVGSLLVSPVAYAQSVPATPGSQKTIPEKDFDLAGQAEPAGRSIGGANGPEW